MIRKKKKLCKGKDHMAFIFSEGMCTSCWKAKYGKPINPISESLKEANKVYKIEKAEYLKGNPMCEAGIICNKKSPSQDIHHKKGRIGSLLTDSNHFLAVCRLDHDWIEIHPKEAKELGFSENRL